MPASNSDWSGPLNPARNFARAGSSIGSALHAAAPVGSRVTSRPLTNPSKIASRMPMVEASRWSVSRRALGLVARRSETSCNAARNFSFIASSR